MPVETVVWLAINAFVGLVTLFSALYVTRTPEMTDAADSPSSGDPPPLSGGATDIDGNEN